MRDNLRHLIREYVRAILSEGPVPLRKPRTEAEHGDWTDAIDLLRTYYVLKRMPFKVEQN